MRIATLTLLMLLTGTSWAGTMPVSRHARWCGDFITDCHREAETAKAHRG